MFRLYSEISDTRREFPAMHSCDANGLHRSSSTLLERNAPGRCVKCVYASARPFRHYTIRRCNCQLAVPGANFLNVRPFARAPASPSVFFFFSKRRSGLTPFGEWSRGTRSVNMIKGGWSFFFSFISSHNRRESDSLQIIAVHEGGINAYLAFNTFLLKCNTICSHKHQFCHYLRT